MAITISFGNNKGGVGKSTASSITSFVLAKHSKVLAVDFDSQGHLTSYLLPDEPTDGRSVFEAMLVENARPYIHKVNVRLDVLPANAELAIFNPDDPYKLKRTLESVADDYDFIIIDMPPHLGKHTYSALSASDYNVVKSLADPFSYFTTEGYLKTIEDVRAHTNQELKIAGVLVTMMDPYSRIDKETESRIRKMYHVFDTVIRKKTHIKQFTLTGISDKSKPQREALEQYYRFAKELRSVVHTAGV